MPVGGHSSEAERTAEAQRAIQRKTDRAEKSSKTDDEKPMQAGARRNSTVR